jgi:TP901 family phage tail tape measure protein
MATQLEKLMFSISLLDRVSGPAGKIQSKMRSLSDTAKDSFSKIAGGGAAAVAAGYSLKQMIMPAHQINLALGDVKSMGVAQKGLDTLTDKAAQFSVKFGGSAKAFLLSSYDIQSGIENLSSSDLGTFTYTGAVLAKATKASESVMTDYMGTMYNYFEKQAKLMGKELWVETMASRTALAVNKYKTEGKKFSDSFRLLTNKATEMGISESEQMAVIGRLQNVTQGGESGTAYKSFLNNIGRAQEKLGLKFTDTVGEIIPLPDILNKINAKFGDLKKVETGGILKEAFGTDEALKVIYGLMAQRELLAADIGEFKATRGLDRAMEMAAARTDSFQRLFQGFEVVKLGLFEGPLESLYAFVNKLADGAGWIYEWTQRYPGFAKTIGYGIAGISSLAGVTGVLAVVTGTAQLATIAFGKGTFFHSTVLKGYHLVLKGVTLTTWLYGLAVKGVTAIVALFRTGILAARGAMVALKVAMMANPVGAVLTLAAGAAAAIYYWDDLKAAFMDSAWGQAIMGVVDTVLGSLKSLWEMITKIFDKITSISGAWGWIKGKIPGLGDDTDLAPASSPALNAPRQGASATGGVSKMISNAVNTDNRRTESRSVHIGQVVTSRPINPQEIGNQLWLAGG